MALAMSFFVPHIFTAIAFDSGGVASGPMTATFMLPFAMGACEAVGGNVITDAFGLVSLVAMMPLITVQVMGAVYVVRSKTTQRYLDATQLADDGHHRALGGGVMIMDFVVAIVDRAAGGGHAGGLPQPRPAHSADHARQRHGNHRST